MNQSKPETRIFRFGVFEFDARSGELRKDGRTEPRLREQASQILTLLLERSRDVVTREELRERLWPSDTFVDFDHGLNTAINQLRAALGDSASSPRFVQTLPRRGYRFIAPVEVTGHGARLPTLEGDQGPGDQESPRDPGKPALAGLSVLSQPSELPAVPGKIVRILFSLIQLLYLVFYVVSLGRLSVLGDILALPQNLSHLVLVTVVLTAAVGIPTRLYLLTAAAFNYRGLTVKFQKIFPFVLILDELWALAPFLISPLIGTGLALAATAALLYLPFSERTLLLMGSVRP
ncbi:MAG TPA: winged helix-turn-helix domain-containing protein [Candidatus Cybelea sp.]|nr:winged helix-turn-helix domain-containing protein [Candidatus Cybelea sp.]